MACTSVAASSGASLHIDSTTIRHISPVHRSAQRFAVSARSSCLSRASPSMRPNSCVPGRIQQSSAERQLCGYLVGLPDAVAMPPAAHKRMLIRVASFVRRSQLVLYERLGDSALSPANSRAVQSRSRGSPSCLPLYPSRQAATPRALDPVRQQVLPAHISSWP